MDLDYVPLTDAEILRLYEVVDACRAAWADHDAWRAALLTGVVELTGADAARIARLVHGPALRAAGSCPCEGGAGATHRARAHVGVRTWVCRVSCDARGSCRLARQVLAQDGLAAPGDLAAACALLDEPATAVVVASPGHARSLGPHAPHVLGLLVDELAPRMGTELSLPSQVGVHGLAPRARETLQQLLLGRSEKQIAQHLGVRPGTAHEYVTVVYRHFEVQSRAELLSYFVRRRPKRRSVPA